ncbi:hypothetical protein M422DRAFT_270080 [Sphaerobolus stellatus SS14]|uniref:Uncharacterized protein n=1 Tax=Sphaerobolus stellatus (strain SS14) TaxID=990650 RepID=A0A0C9TGM2_SPHS4|nr:hypothetical protein M422DRAFT_270080 [Sphaerobolus stellatus SS14]
MRPPLPISPVDMRTPLPSPHGLQFPLPPMGQPSPQLLERRTRSGSDARSLRGDTELRVSNLVAALNANLHVNAHSRTDSAKLAELAKADADAEYKRAKELREAESAELSRQSHERRDSHIIVDFLEELGMGNMKKKVKSDVGLPVETTGEKRVDSEAVTRARSGSGESEISILQRSTHSTPRQEYHARADSHTLGALLQGFQPSPSKTEKTAHGHVRADSQTLPTANKTSTWQMLVDSVEESPADEDEQQTSKVKVSQWLVDRPDSTSSLGHASNVTAGSSFSQGLASLEAWREQLGGADEDDVMPGLEKIVLEVEERMRRDGLKPELESQSTSASEGSSTKKKRESRGFFGRRAARSENTTPVPSSPLLSRIPKSPSLPRLSSSSARTSLLPPPSPRLPKSPTTSARSASPGASRQAVNARIHTPATILLEAEDIKDPESKRVSEAVYLS